MLIKIFALLSTPSFDMEILSRCRRGAHEIEGYLREVKEKEGKVMDVCGIPRV